jgi:tRNA pseudouridine55 synthase
MTAEAVPAQATGRRRARRRGRALHGWLVIDKPSGVTSTRVVGLVRRKLDAAKAGHGGTLDPLATGVLPIALGEATKTVGYVVEGLKRYRFTVRWGEGRDTDDADGAVIETSPRRPSAAEIRAALPGFVGEIMQVPPAYSAVKVAGRRAYDLARRDEPVALEARPVRIDRLELVEVPDADSACFEMACGKGGYVRALVRDLAHALGTCGHVAALCRTRVGPFGLEDAISLAELERLDDSGAAAEWLLPVARGLAGLPALPVNADQASRLKRGQPIFLVRPPVSVEGVPLSSGTVWAVFADRPVAVGELGAGELRPVRVFNF